MKSPLILLTILLAGMLLTACGGGDDGGKDSDKDTTDPPAIVNTGEPQPGLLYYDEDRASDGYVLFHPMRWGITYLIDNFGYLVHSWDAREYSDMVIVRLLADGNLIRLGVTSNDQASSVFQADIVDWDGNKVWEFMLPQGSDYLLHHDIEMLPNGNILILASFDKTYQEALDQGRDPSTLVNTYLKGDAVLEIKPTYPEGGEIVWQWRVWDHLVQDYDETKPNYGVVSEHPERIDLNFTFYNNYDFTHMNTVRYIEEYDQILLSVREFSEVWVIDHSTTSEEAAGHTGGNSGKGGDLLYRWGNPMAYGMGTTSDRQLYFQHTATMFDDPETGVKKILVYSNGQGTDNGEDDEFSTVVEFSVPVDDNGNYSYDMATGFGPQTTDWELEELDGETFYSDVIAGAQRLPNGNTLVNEGTEGHFFEVTPDKENVWEYRLPVETNNENVPPTYRVLKYPVDYEGLKGKDLSRKGFVEYDGELPLSVYNFLMLYVAPSESKALDFSLVGEFAETAYALHQKLSIVFPVSWVDYIAGSYTNMAALRHWMEQGHEIGAYHLSEYEEDWDGYTDLSGYEAAVLRTESGLSNGTYLGTLDDFMNRMSMLDIDITTGCMTESQDVMSMPDGITVSTCLGFANNGNPGSTRDGDSTDFARNAYASTSVVNGEKRTWLSHARLDSLSYKSILNEYPTVTVEPVFGVYAIVNTATRSTVMDYMDWLYDMDPEGSYSRTIREVVDQGILNESDVTAIVQD